MKKIFIAFVCLFGISVMVFFGLVTKNENVEYLRIHIRANSNLDIDQSVKYKVKDAVVEAMIPFLSLCKTKKEAETAVKNNFELIEKTANLVLLQNGFTYTSKAKINNEEFPTREYGGKTFEQGFYDALILELGEGVGDNWWCVVYPPLCFIQNNPSGEGVVYRSKLVEIVKSFFS